MNIYGGCRKFLLLFGRIGPLALRPCALLRAWVFLPHSINILQIPLWYGDMMWYGVSCARPCAPLARALHFWCLYIMLSKSYLPRRCDWKDGVLYRSPYIIDYVLFFHILTYWIYDDNWWHTRNIILQLWELPSWSQACQQAPWSSAVLGNTGVIILPTQTMHYDREIPEIYHRIP